MLRIGTLNNCAARAFALALRVAIGALLLLTVRCSTGEGERCNPLRFSDECAQGLACTTPKDCVVSVCCPAAGRASTSEGCNACTPVDGGTTD